MNHINIFHTPLELAKEVARLIQQKANEKAASNEQLYVAISGGNTPKLLFELLAEEYNTSIPWNNIQFYWVDERCVPPENEESNYGVANDILFNQIEIEESQIERIKGENDSGEEALRYSGILSSQLPLENGIPSFDLILLGMGDDGHTASIFPNQLELIKSENFCEVGTHPTSGQKRVTLTTKVINNAVATIFLVTGKNKAEIIKEIITKKGNYTKYPAANVKPHNGNLVWMLDKEASMLL